MSSARFQDLDQTYDAGLISALPSALSLFPTAALVTQFADMAKQKRALCFTLIVPTRRFGDAARADASTGTREHMPATAAVLVCLHVAPELAARGPASLMADLERAAREALDPIHQFAGPLARAGYSDGSGFYREAVYEGGDDLYISITTHSPVEIPPETAAVVAKATQGCPVDIVTTVAITPDRPNLSAAIPSLRPAPRPTLH